jgi:hypothetical protein
LFIELSAFPLVFNKKGRLISWYLVTAMYLAIGLLTSLTMLSIGMIIWQAFLLNNRELVERKQLRVIL